MKKWFNKINLYYKVSFLSVINVFIISLILICIFCHNLLIPLSFAIGGFFGSFFYFLYGLVEKKEISKTKFTISIIITASRLIILIIIFLIIALIYKFNNFVLLEPISLVLGYFLPIIILVITTLTLERSKRKNDSN